MAKILIAEDEPEISQFYSFNLKKRNHTVIIAETGPKALEALKKEKPDLIILDVMLPGMDGHTLQMQISQDESLHHTPVLVITALQPTEALFKKFSQVVGFLPKPFSPDEFVQAVDKALNSGIKK